MKDSLSEYYIPELQNNAYSLYADHSRVERTIIHSTVSYKRRHVNAQPEAPVFMAMAQGFKG